MIIRAGAVRPKNAKKKIKKSKMRSTEMEKRFHEGKIFLNTVMVGICVDIGVSRWKEDLVMGN